MAQVNHRDGKSLWKILKDRSQKLFKALPLDNGQWTPDCVSVNLMGSDKYFVEVITGMNDRGAVVALDRQMLTYNPVDQKLHYNNGEVVDTRNYSDKGTKHGRGFAISLKGEFCLFHQNGSQSVHGAVFDERPLMMAGVIIICDGKIQNILGDSGHYVPDMLDLHRTVEWLEKNLEGVLDSNDTIVTICDAYTENRPYKMPAFKAMMKSISTRSNIPFHEEMLHKRQSDHDEYVTKIKSKPELLKISSIKDITQFSDKQRTLLSKHNTIIVLIREEPLPPLPMKYNEILNQALQENHLDILDVMNDCGIPLNLNNTCLLLHESKDSFLKAINKVFFSEYQRFFRLHLYFKLLDQVLEMSSLYGLESLLTLDVRPKLTRDTAKKILKVSKDETVYSFFKFDLLSFYEVVIECISDQSIESKNFSLTISSILLSFISKLTVRPSSEKNAEIMPKILELAKLSMNFNNDSPVMTDTKEMMQIWLAEMRQPENHSIFGDFPYKIEALIKEVSNFDIMGYVSEF